MEKQVLKLTNEDRKWLSAAEMVGMLLLVHYNMGARAWLFLLWAIVYMVVGDMFLLCISFGLDDNEIDADNQGAVTINDMNQNDEDINAGHKIILADLSYEMMKLYAFILIVLIINSAIASCMTGAPINIWSEFGLRIICWIFFWFHNKKKRKEAHNKSKFTVDYGSSIWVVPWDTEG